MQLWLASLHRLKVVRFTPLVSLEKQHLIEEWNMTRHHQLLKQIQSQPLNFFKATCMVEIH